MTTLEGYAKIIQEVADFYQILSCLPHRPRRRGSKKTLYAGRRSPQRQRTGTDLSSAPQSFERTIKNHKTPQQDSPYCGVFILAQNTTRQ